MNIYCVKSLIRGELYTYNTSGYHNRFLRLCYDHELEANRTGGGRSVNKLFSNWGKNYEKLKQVRGSENEQKRTEGDHN